MNENEIKRLNDLKKAYTSFIKKPENEKLRIKDIANHLKVSEAELLSCQIDSSNLKYLKILDYNIFFKDLFKSKKVMFLIRSNYIVHEKVVICSEIEYHKNKIFYKDKKSLIDFNYHKIENSFFEKKIHQNKPLLSFQFFDKYGHAILKIFLKSKDYNIFESLADKFSFTYDYSLQKNLYQNNEIIDQKKSINLDSQKNQNTKKIKTDNLILRTILEYASQNKFPIQIHASGNHSVQYHFGLVRNIMDFGPWINVIDKNFNIHVMENKISNNFITINEINGKCFYQIQILDENNNLILLISADDKYHKEFNEIIDRRINL